MPGTRKKSVNLRRDDEDDAPGPEQMDVGSGTEDDNNCKVRRSGRAVKRPAKYLASPDTNDAGKKLKVQPKTARSAEAHRDDDDEGEEKEKFQPKAARRSRSAIKKDNPTDVDGIANGMEPKPSTSAAAQSKPNVDNKCSTGKGGKGRNSEAVMKKGPAEKTQDDKDIIQLWTQPPYKPQEPEWVEILHGKHLGSMLNFINENLFRVFLVTETGEKLLSNISRTTDYNVVVKADVNNLRCKLLTEPNNRSMRFLTGDCDHLPMDDYQRIFQIIRKTMPTPAMSEFDKSCVLPNNYAVQQPGEIKIELKQYQLNAMAWMKSLEDRVDKKWTASKLLEWKHSGMDLLFDVNLKVVYKPDAVPRSNRTVLGIKAKGGIYADQMGLGKTITLLSLFAVNKSEAPKIPTPEKVQQQDDFYLETNATLVIAPSHLIAQWKEEVEEHTNNMTVVIITTMPQYDKLRYLDILQADIVIVSVQFLTTNKTFADKGAEGCINFMRLMMKPGINVLHQTAPNLYHFMWWRIVADEAHELLTYEEKNLGRGKYSVQASPGLEIVSKLSSRFRWYVTGTPFPHGTRSLRAALKFIELEVDDPTLVHSDGSLKVDQAQRMRDNSNEPNLFTYPLYNFVRNTFYVRNTKESVGAEFDVPEFIEEMILLTMSPFERAVYDRATSNRNRRQLCCHLQIEAHIRRVAGVQQKSLEEVRAALVDHNEKALALLNRSIDDYESNIKESEETPPNDGQTDFEKRWTEIRLSSLKSSVKCLKEKRDKCANAANYFASIVPRIEHWADEPCVICLDTIANLTVTPCGHLFCYTCILPFVHQQGTCPTCRANVLERGLIQVKDPKLRTELKKSEELRRMTAKYGTKMAYLIFYLRNLFFESETHDARVIIFSQWDPLLQKIGETLEENEIENVFVKGNVHMRNKAIMSFRRQKETRVIMLSLENAASGTNLVEATHVILIDPVAGTKEEAIAIESQAIGRAHRMGQHKQISVVRMIMKDTIEHQLYMRNKSDDLEQIEFNFEKTNPFGGPEIVRRKHTLAEPNPAVLRSALDSFLAEAGGSYRDRAWRWQRYMNMMPVYAEPDGPAEEDDMRGMDNCTIS